MAETSYSVTLKMAYKDTDYTRTYKFTNIASESTLTGLKAKVLSYNANLPAADKAIFVADTYDDTDPQNVIGTLESITAASYEVVEYTRINLN